MLIKKQYLKQVIIEETKKFLKEANNFDGASGTPLTDAAWAKSGEEFFSTPWGEFLRLSHIKAGGKFDSKTGVPVGGIRNFPTQYLGNFYKMFKSNYDAKVKAEEESKKYWSARDAETQQLRKQAEIKEKQAQELIKQEQEKVNALIKQEQEKIIQKLGGGSFVNNKYVPPSPEEERQIRQNAKQNANQNTKQIQDELNKQVSFLNNLKAELQKAPNSPSAQEKQLFNSIIQPHFDKVDKITNDADKIQSPQELRNYMTNVWRPAIRETTPTIMKYYQEVKKTGQIISKPYMKMIIDSIQSDVNNLQNSLKNSQQSN